MRFLSDIPPVNTKSEFSPFSITYHMYLGLFREPKLSSFCLSSADSYREGYKACLQRVSAQLPKTNVGPDACQRVNDFVHKSMSAYSTPACQNCCAQSSRSFPQMHQKLLSLKSSFRSRLESQQPRSGAAAGPCRAQADPEPLSAAVWRPW